MSAEQTSRPRRKSRLPRRVALVAMSTALALLLAEGYVRLFIPVRNVGPAFSMYDPVYGKRLKKNFTCTRITPEFTMRLTTNSLGLRGPEPAQSSRQPLLFLGDSFTMGYGVDDGREFPALVRRALGERFGAGEIPVLNAGTGALGTGRWVKFLRAEGTQINPRCIILQVCSNDFSDNLHERLFGLAEDGALVEAAGPPEPGFARKVQGLVEAIPGLSYSYLFSLVRQVATAPRGRDEAAQAAALKQAGRESPVAALTYRILERVAEICRRHEWPLIALIVGAEDRRLLTVQELFEQRGVPCVVIPARAGRPDLYFQIDGHWTENGHAFVADCVLEQLLSMPELWSALDEGPQLP